MAEKQRKKEDQTPKRERTYDTGPTDSRGMVPKDSDKGQ